MIAPQTKAKFRKFLNDRKAFYSLIFLGIFFLASLPAELIFNDKPLVLKIDGKTYYPVFKDYSMSDFGGKGDVPVQNYRSETFQNFLDGREVIIEDKLKDVFGGSGGLGLEEELQDFEEIPEEIPEEAPPEKENQQTPDKTVELKTRINPDKVKDYWILWAPVKVSYKSHTENPQSGRRNLASPADPDTSKKSADGEIIQEKSSWVDEHYLGTDQNGKDVLARIVYGFRISMIFGLALAITSTILGVILGAIQGFFGGLIDLVGQRLSELWSSLPELYLLIIFSSFLVDHVTNLSTTKHYLMLFGIFNLTAWMGMAAYTRAEFLKARNQDYVKAARALGVSDAKIMFRHILPNAYWIILPTFVVLTVTLTLLTFIGEGVRNAFDPRMSQ